MKKILYSVQDKKAGFFGSPFFSLNDAMAARDFNNAAEEPGTLLNKNPEDFALYRLGSYDTESGSVESEKQPVWVSNVKIMEVSNGLQDS